MEDLRSQALVLIYPDSEMEKVPVMKGKAWQLDYFKWLFENSQKFATVIYYSPYKIDFKDWTILDKTLAEAGLVVIRNLEVIYVSNDISIINSKESFAYLINLPNNIRENNAYPFMKKIIKENQNEKYTFGIYSLETKEFEEIKYDFEAEKLENIERRNEL